MVSIVQYIIANTNSQTHKQNTTSFRSVGIDIGACVALQFANLSHKPTAVRLKSLGFEPPMPLCSAMILESPAIAPAVGIAASMLQFSAPPEPFVGVRKLLNDIVIPVFVAVGSKRTTIDATLVSVNYRERKKNTFFFVFDLNF